jgi:hypothetical protein
MELGSKKTMCQKERIIELYNQGKTYREISKEARISPHDIGIILNKAIEEKKTEGEEGIKQDNNNDGGKNEQEEHLSLSTKAYKLGHQQVNIVGYSKGGLDARIPR